jgi:choice-of-anchor B domain-containing protein
MYYYLRTVGFLLLLACDLNMRGQEVSENVSLIGRWNDSEVPFNGFHNTYNEVWGFVWKEREYGVIGSREGVYIIDVTSPEYPNLVTFIKGKAGKVTNRDYHDYGGYLYMVADQGESSLQIVDLHDLPDSVSVVYDTNALFSRCHNIFIDSSSARLYACSVKRDTLKYDLQIYSLKEPTSPELLLSYDAPAAFHDVYVKNDTAYGNNEREGMFVYDFTDLQQPKVLGAVTDYPEKGYNHSGWTTTNGQYYFFADETHGSDIKICDVRHLDNIEVVATFNSGVAEEAIPHNVIVKGNKLYISYYHDGLQVFDISTPSLPKKVGFYDTYLAPDHEGSKGAWGVYPFLPSGKVLVSDREKGLFILDDSKAVLPDTIQPPVFTVFPNPFNEYLGVSHYEGQNITLLQLFDMKGIKWREVAPSHSANPFLWFGIQEMPAGTYLLKIKSENQTVYRKLIKSF